MIKILFSEVNSPLTSEESIDLDNSSAVRAVNVSSKAAKLFIINSKSRETKSITVTGSESLILKKHSSDTVYASSKSVLIAGISIY